MRSASIELFSPAKLNLFFRVLHKRQDGYHEIASLYQAIDLGDRLALTEATEDRLTCSDSSLSTGEDNLITRALHLFRSASRMESLRVRCHLHKNIPMEAGLGGGSSNAATMLFGLNELTGRPLDQRHLQGLAASLGSDPPFFFSSGTAYCTGRGEIFSDVLLPLHDLLPAGESWIAKPCLGSSTPRVYQACKPDLLASRDPIETLRGFQCGTPGFFNDLEEAAFDLHPELLIYKKQLQALGFTTVVMMGSGSSFLCIGPLSKCAFEPKLDDCSSGKEDLKYPYLDGVRFYPIGPAVRNPSAPHYWYYNEKNC